MKKLGGAVNALSSPLAPTEKLVKLQYQNKMTGELFHGASGRSYKVNKAHEIYVLPSDAEAFVKIVQYGKHLFVQLGEVQAAAVAVTPKGGLESRLTGDEPPSPFGSPADKLALSNVVVPDDSPKLPEEALKEGLSALVAEAEEEPLPDFDYLTIAELREWAQVNDIDLGNATRKIDIVTAIRQHYAEEE